MPVIGVVQNVLEKRWTEKGYRLLDDEDFILLYSPGKSDPDVFSSCGATQESINKHIATIEGEM